MLDLFIGNATIVESDRIYRGGIGVKDGKTVLLTDQDTIHEAAKHIDVKGHYVFPGAIDCHAHLNDPGFNWREDFPHGSRAAVAGGVTTIIDMPMQNTPALTSPQVFQAKQQYVSGKSAADYCFWGGLVDNNLAEIEGLAKAGVVALKAFTSPTSPDYSTTDMGLARQAMLIAAKQGIMLGFHCEDYSIIVREEALAKAENRTTRKDFLRSRPVMAEWLATANVLALAKETGAKVHICHVSHPDVAEIIRQAQLDGVSVTAETCAHYLAFTENDMLECGMLFKCAPPLRAPEDAERLWRYVVDGTLSCMGSDHSPAEESEKDEEAHGVFGAWGGISGIQNYFQVFYDLAVNKRGLSPTLVAQRLSAGPAKAFGIAGRKGAIALGLDADYVIVDPNQQWEITKESLLYKNKLSAFVGLKGTGLPVTSILRGNIILCDGNFAEKNHGQFIPKDSSL